MKLVTIRVSGLVQGIGFRWTVRKAAYKFGINGFVRNNDDGSVTIEAEGTDEQINAFIDWCKNGQTSARVDRIEVIEGKMKFHSAFSILA